MGGKLRHGDPGVRLFEASASGLEYFTAVPASFRAEEGKWRIAPYYHLFGSDELSQRAPVFQSRMPEPYIKLNPADAAKLGVNLWQCSPLAWKARPCVCRWLSLKA